jgi:hypothetical protein
MAEEKQDKQKFDDELKEILSAGPDHAAGRRLPMAHTTPQPAVLETTSTGNSEKWKLRLEMIVRIAFGAFVILMLLLFGMQIANR